MKNLKELEQKYLELGKEIEALKKQNIEKEEFNYPIYCKLKDSSSVVKFTKLQSGEVVVNSKQYNIGDKISYNNCQYFVLEIGENTEDNLHELIIGR